MSDIARQPLPTPLLSSSPGPEQNARLSAEILASSPEAILCLDSDWVILWANPLALKLSQRSTEDIDRNYWEIYPQALGTEIEVVYRRAMQTRVRERAELFYAPFGGWYDISVVPSSDGGLIVYLREMTESRRAESAFRDQQALLTSIQQAAGVATWELDLRTGALSFGSGSAPVFGLPLAALDHLDQLRQAIDPALRDTLSRDIEEAKSSAGASVHEYRMLPPDGRTLWVETRAQVVLKDGVPTLLRGLAIDITRRKQDEEASEASEARYRVLVDLNPQALWSGNVQGQVVYANQGFLDYLGLDEADANGWITSFAPEDRDRVVTTWTHCVQTGAEYDLEARLVRGSDGAARWWHLRALPVRDETGAIVQWLGVASDIHDRKTFAETLLQLQSQTERERAELETLYKTAPIGLALFDLDDFHYLRLNDRQAAFFNLKPEEIVGQTVTKLAPIPGLREMFEDVARGNPVVNHLLEGELSSHPGEHRFWTVSYFPVYGPNGAIQAISAASLEITQQKKAEAALVQSEKLAAVGRLASSISHEINNPLEAITNLLYLASIHSMLPEDLREYIQLAQSELARVSQIATQTLRFHRQAMRPTRVDAATLVNAVLTLYQGRLNNSGITVDTNFASTSPVFCFENDIRQVLNNLIANAIDAMRAGGHLLARAQNTIDPRTGEPIVRITIADTGHGMSAATLKRIYEPFYTTKDLNGTGLGLWISAGIMDRHHGRIRVRSSMHPIHHGTVFSLLLPLDPQGVGKAPSPSPDDRSLAGHSISTP